MKNPPFPLVLFAVLAACGSAPQAPEPAPAPAKEAPPVEAPPAPAGPIVAGTITLAAGLEPKAQAVYVSARAAGRPGPPLAAKRLPVGPFPLAFELTSADRPMGDGPIPDALEVKVTLDGDGDPMSKDPADPTATVPAKPGQTDLTLALGAP